MLSRRDYTEVHIAERGFEPQTVRTDGVVVWKNLDSVPRQVISTSGAFESPVIQPGDDWQFVFPPGTHGYCDASGSFSASIRQTREFSEVPGDVVLMIDNSGSMVGDSIRRAREVSKNIVGALGPNDRAALVVFDYRAQLVQQLTSNRQGVTSAIDSIVSQGGTLYISAFEQAANAISHSDSSRERVVMLLSSGTPHDLEGI